MQETLAQGVKAIAPGATVSVLEWNWGPYSCCRAAARQHQGVGPPPLSPTCEKPQKAPRAPQALGLSCSAQKVKAQVGLRLPEGLVVVRQEVDLWASLRMHL